MATNKNAQHQDLKPVFRTTDFSLLIVVKSFLDSARISYVVQGEEGLHLFPLAPSSGFFSPKALSAVIFVRPEDLNETRQLIQSVESDGQQ